MCLMRCSTIFCVSILTVVAVSGCAMRPTQQADAEQLRGMEEAPWGDPDAVVAVVNDREITQGEFYRRVLLRLGTLSTLGGVVKDELFRQEAERRGITVDAQEVEAAVTERLLSDAAELPMANGHMASPINAGDPRRALAELERIYEREGLTLEDVRRDYAQQTEQQLLNDKIVQAMREVNDGALREHYRRTWAQTRYGVSHIAYSYAHDGSPSDIRRQECMEKALRARREIEGGRTFAELARLESEDDVTRRRGGKIGYVTLDMPMHPVMRDAIQNLEMEQTSAPLDNSEIGSVHLFRLDEVLPHKPFHEVRAAMVTEIEDAPPTPQEIMATLERLRREARVELRIVNPGGLGR